MKLVATPMAAQANPPDERVSSVMPRRAGALPRQAQSAVAACLMLGLGGALGAALACGSDEPAVEAGANPTGNAAGRGNSGATATAGTGGGNASAPGAGAGGVSGTGNGGESSAGTAGAADNLPEEPLFQGISESCPTGDSSELCGWSLASELTGAACTPGDQVLLGCCDCGASYRSTSQDDPFLRVCEGSTSCSESASIGFADDGCQFCPVAEFTCPASGVYSALVGAYPSAEFDAESNVTFVAAPVPSSCKPKLIDASDRAAVGDAGTVSFADIHPILVTNCGRCHAEDTGLGLLLGLPPFASADVDVAFEAAVGYRPAILGQINAGVMPADTCDGPPGSPGCVSVADFALLRKWFASGSPR